MERENRLGLKGLERMQEEERISKKKAKLLYDVRAEKDANLILKK